MAIKKENVAEKIRMHKQSIIIFFSLIWMATSMVLKGEYDKIEFDISFALSICLLGGGISLVIIDIRYHEICACESSRNANIILRYDRYWKILMALSKEGKVEISAIEKQVSDDELVFGAKAQGLVKVDGEIYLILTEKGKNVARVLDLYDLVSEV